MVWLWVLVGLLVILGSVLAMAETSVSRMSRVRSMALREAGRRHADLLERIQEEPTRYLNGIYLCVMFVQNGSAILVAILVELAFGEVAVTYLSVVFTLAYFVVVEAMSKTFGILHSDAVALRLAPVVWAIGRALNGPTRLLIGLANVLLPGKGLKEGPFVSPEDIRSMVEVGREEGDRGAGAYAHPFDLRDRTHEGTRGDGAPARHDQCAGRNTYQRVARSDAGTRPLAAPRLPGRQGGGGRRDLRRGPPAPPSGERRRPPRRCGHARADLRAGDQGRVRPPPGDAAAAHPHRHGRGRARLGDRPGHARGSPGGAGGRDHR